MYDEAEVWWFSQDFNNALPTFVPSRVTKSRHIYLPLHRAADSSCVWLTGCLPSWKESTLALSCDLAVHRHYKSHSLFSVYMSRVIRNDSIWWRGAYLLLVPQGRRLLETGPLLGTEHSFLFWETAACETTLWCL